MTLATRDACCFLWRFGSKLNALQLASVSVFQSMLPQHALQLGLLQSSLGEHDSHDATCEGLKAPESELVPPSVFVQAASGNPRALKEVPGLGFTLGVPQTGVCSAAEFYQAVSSRVHANVREALNTGDDGLLAKVLASGVSCLNAFAVSNLTGWISSTHCVHANFNPCPARSNDLWPLNCLQAIWY